MTRRTEAFAFKMLSGLDCNVETHLNLPRRLLPIRIYIALVEKDIVAQETPWTSCLLDPATVSIVAGDVVDGMLHVRRLSAGTLAMLRNTAFVIRRCISQLESVHANFRCLWKKLSVQTQALNLTELAAAHVLASKLRRLARARERG